MTTWMSGPCQGNREGQKEAGCFLAPPFPQACCAAFVPRLANPFPSCSTCFHLCFFSPPTPAPPPPRIIEMSIQDVGPICVNPACSSFALVSLQPEPISAHLQTPLPHCMASSFCPQLCKHNWASSTSRFSPLLTKVASYNKGRESDLLP